MASRRVSPQCVETDHWRFTWSPGQLSIDPLQGAPCQHHYRIQGDPHFYMDDQIKFDFPNSTCTFVFTDGTVLVCEAAAANQALRDCHIFTTDGEHFAEGQVTQFNEQCGWLFIQQEGTCEFFCTAAVPIKNNVGTVTVQPRYADR